MVIIESLGIGRVGDSKLLKGWGFLEGLDEEKVREIYILGEWL